MIFREYSLKEKLEDWFIDNYLNLYCAMRKTLNSPDGVTPNPYHLEESVWDHTLMVMGEVESRYSNGEFNTSKREFEILMLSALLHDTGKVVTKNVKIVNGELKSTFYKHECASYMFAIAILSDKSLRDVIDRYDDNFASRVLSIVGNHDVYKYEKLEDVERCLNFKTALGNFIGDSLVPLSISLTKFTICDSMGRITSSDISKRVERFEKYLESNAYKSDWTYTKHWDSSWLGLDLRAFGGDSYFKLKNFSNWLYASDLNEFNRLALKYVRDKNSLITFRKPNYGFYTRSSRSFLRNCGKKMKDVYSNYSTAVFVVKSWNPKDDVQRVLNGFLDCVIKNMKVPTAEEVDEVLLVGTLHT